MSNDLSRQFLTWSDVETLSVPVLYVLGRMDWRTDRNKRKWNPKVIQLTSKSKYLLLIKNVPFYFCIVWFTALRAVPCDSVVMLSSWSSRGPHYTWLHTVVVLQSKDRWRLSLTSMTDSPSTSVYFFMTKSCFCLENQCIFQASLILSCTVALLVKKSHIYSEHSTISMQCRAQCAMHFKSGQMTWNMKSHLHFIKQGYNTIRKTRKWRQTKAFPSWPLLWVSPCMQEKFTMALRWGCCIRGSLRSTNSLIFPVMKALEFYKSHFSTKECSEP